MESSGTINLIKDSFEAWYNKNVSPNSPVAIVINYKDEQKLSIRAYHTVTIEMQSIGTDGELAVITPMFSISEVYNHGVTSELEAKDSVTKKLLEKLYAYQFN